MAARHNEHIIQCGTLLSSKEKEVPHSKHRKFSEVWFRVLTRSEPNYSTLKIQAA
jgi:hypothetical protein